MLALLSGTPGVADAHALSDDELGELLRPWLGSGAERLARPAARGDRRAPGRARMSSWTALRGGWTRLAPGTLVESHGGWMRRLAVLARSLQACAGLALLLVAAVAAAVITVATRAGLAARREAIEIVHGLGATDGYIAARFAGRATLLAATGGVAGAVLALPVLLTLAQPRRAVRRRRRRGRLADRTSLTALPAGSVADAARACRPPRRSVS